MITPRLGCHLSLGTKPEFSLGEARRNGVECAQIFTSSPGAWKPPVFSHQRETACLAARTEHGIYPLFVHAIYLINLASCSPDLVDRSKSSLIATLQAAARLDAVGVVTHIGSHGGLGFDAVLDQVVSSLRQVLESTPDSVDLILENSAGAGGIIGAHLGDLSEILQRLSRYPRLKFAIDTAHLCAAGWDFTLDDTAEKLVDSLESTVGFDRLALVHANDSRTSPGSHRDRHANVGAGYIGVTGFRSLLDQPQLRCVPWITETPDLDSRVPAEQRFGSLALLRTLRADEGLAEKLLVS